MPVKWTKDEVAVAIRARLKDAKMMSLTDDAIVNVMSNYTFALTEIAYMNGATDQYQQLINDGDLK